MKHLNNKGITTIEVIICFILVVTISSSMFSTVAAFNEKRILEQYKEEIYTYKNLLTREIQDDFIKVGITEAHYDVKVTGNQTTHTVDCIMKDGTNRKLVIKQSFAYSDFHPSGSRTTDDAFMISYGTQEDLIDYPIPELGYTTNENGHKVQDFSINNVLIKIENDNILRIYIGFYHPELTTRFGIQVICPINYVSSGRDVSSRLNLYG